MAHIPYGYLITDGKAQVSPGQAEKLKSFFSLYLDGNSIQSAGSRAGIELDRTTLGRMLCSPVYLGTEYYPPIISRDLFEAAARERERRHRNKGAKKIRKGHTVLPVHTVFTMKKAEVHYPDPVQDAAYLYSLITNQPPSDGRSAGRQEGERTHGNTCH